MTPFDDVLDRKALGNMETWGHTALVVTEQDALARITALRHMMRHTHTDNTSERDP